MIYRYVRVFPVVVATLVTSCGVTRAVAKDYFLTIGGGSDVTSNQLSSGKKRHLPAIDPAQQRPDHPDFEIWFADGNDKSRDVQCRDPDFDKTCPPARRLLAEVLGDAGLRSTSCIETMKSRDSKALRNLKLVKKRFGSLGKRLKSGDRVIIYATGHGGRPKRSERGRRRAARTLQHHLYFWNSETVSASEFADWLDRFPPDVQVVLIMVQCYAGGFSHTIFQHADAKAGLSPHERCGFFAQMHDRAAAGCTPDADEADFEEYSGCFWSALAGKSRDGKTINSADYDKNGRVSFAEAHAYAMIESDTIDVPVRTSERAVATVQPSWKFGWRRHRRLQLMVADQPSTNENDAPSNEDAAELTKMNGPISKLLTTCRPDQRAILEQLPDKCELGH